MPLSDNISIGMENFTTLAFRKLNFTYQEFHIKNFSKAIEFQQESPIIGIVISKVGLDFENHQDYNPNNFDQNFIFPWQDLDITSKVEANGWRKVNTSNILISTSSKSSTSSPLSSS